MKPTEITNANLSTPFSFADYYFQTFTETLVWKLYQLTDDSRAGTIQVSENRTRMKVYTGQMGVALSITVLALSRDTWALRSQSDFDRLP